MFLFEKYKLKESEYKESKKHYVDMYNALRLIEEENYAVILALGAVDIYSKFSVYDLADMINDLNLVRLFESYDEWCEKSIDSSKLRLKSVLNFNKIDYQDFNGELIDLINENNISLEDWLNDFSYLSDDGKELLDDLRWIGIYVLYMYEFDFDDYYYFISDKSGKIKDLTLDYLDEHLKIAEKNNDTEHTTHCEATKTLINYLWKKPVEFNDFTSSPMMVKFDRYAEKLKDKYN